MRKIFLLLLACLMLTGCGKVSEEAGASKTGEEIEERGGDATEKSETETSMVEEELALVEKLEPDKIPQYVQKIYQCYKELQETYDLQYAAVEGKEPKGVNQYGYEYIVEETEELENIKRYKFHLTDRDNSKKEMEFTFEAKDYIAKIMGKSYYIEFVPSGEQYFKDVITATFMITGGYEYSEAQEKMQKFINSYQRDYYSAPPFYSGNYTLFFSSQSSNGSVNFHVVYNEEIFADLDKEEYSPADHDMYLSYIMNAGAKMRLIGKIVDKRTDNSHIVILIVADEDGKEYEVHFSYESNPTQFEIGEQYVFYGSISKTLSGSKGWIGLEGIEPYED